MEGVMNCPGQPCIGSLDLRPSLLNRLSPRSLFIHRGGQKEGGVGREGGSFRYQVVDLHHIEHRPVTVLKGSKGREESRLCRVLNKKNKLAPPPETREGETPVFDTTRAGKEEGDWQNKGGNDTKTINRTYKPFVDRQLIYLRISRKDDDR